MSEEFRSALDILNKDSLNPAEVRELKDELLALAAGVKRRMDQGLSPEEMIPARGLWQACRAAQEAVQKLSDMK